MKHKPIVLFVCNLFLLLILTAFTNNWIRKKGKSFDINYTAKDKASIKEYEKMLSTGLQTVSVFFDSAFKNKFEVFIHADRQSFDEAIQLIKTEAGYNPGCMVVSGNTATRMDILHFKNLDSVACGKQYLGKENMQQQVNAALFNMYHTQQLKAVDLSKSENIDWFTVGLAAYASGQLDSITVSKVKQEITERTYPKTLNIFSDGPLGYGFSGTVVMLIDKNYGRKRLKSLLTCTTKQQILDLLHTTEKDLLASWAKYFKVAAVS